MSWITDCLFRETTFRRRRQMCKSGRICYHLEINAAVVRGGRWENLMNGAWKTISGWLGREMEARNLEESEIERRKMNLKAVEQLPDSVVHLTYLTKQKLD